MCMCNGGAQGPGTTCQWCGIGNGVPDNVPKQIAIEVVRELRSAALHSKEMRKIWGERWDEDAWTVRPEGWKP